MKRFFVATTVTIFMATSAQAVSDLRILRTSGFWQSYYTITKAGEAICGMRSQFEDRGRVEGSLLVKFVKGNPTIIVHAFKHSWRIPNGIKIPVYMTFDGSGPYTAIGTGISDNLNYVHFEIAPDFSKKFLNLFASANRMTLGFTEGTEGPWTADMTGSRQATDSFARCVVAIAGGGGTSSTQPHGNGSTQPYGGGSSPTQPFGRQTPKPPSRDNNSI